jgi:hypothetical protein
MRRPVCVFFVTAAVFGIGALLLSNGSSATTIPDTGFLSNESGAVTSPDPGRLPTGSNLTAIPEGEQVSTVTCYNSGEQVDDMSKLCFYDCICGTKVLNLKSYQLCPISAKFDC